MHLVYGIEILKYIHPHELLQSIDHFCSAKHFYRLRYIHIWFVSDSLLESHFNGERQDEEKKRTYSTIIS